MSGRDGYARDRQGQPHRFVNPPKEAVDIPLTHDILASRCWSGTITCGVRERGNAGEKPDCPAAVSGNDRRHGTDLRVREAIGQKGELPFIGPMKTGARTSASPKTCRQRSGVAFTRKGS